MLLYPQDFPLLPSISFCITGIFPTYPQYCQEFLRNSMILLRKGIVGERSNMQEPAEHSLSQMEPTVQTYTFGQCAKLLDIDPKVFRRWVREDLGLQEEEQVSLADRRVRYLTQEQLERLAKLHEHTLSIGSEQAQQERVTSGFYKLLEDRLGAVEDALRACEQTASSAQEGLAQVLERLTPTEQSAERMAQIETRLEQLARTQDQPDHRLVELEARHQQQVAELEAGYQRQIAELQAQLARYRTGERTPSTAPSTTTKKTGPRSKHLPKTLASRSAFAALHHVPDPVVARACNSGKIAATSGKWLYKSRIIFQALGERGQQDFYQLFHTRPDFTPCKHCPHEINRG